MATRPGKFHDSLLAQIHSPADLRELDFAQLRTIADEIRQTLCRLSDQRAIHFASNLGVVELSIALHRVFDFSKDRLIWDTGHQCYPHKILTGRYESLHTIRTKGGLMGFPNPKESPYDLMMTGHAGCSIGTALGLACGDALRRTLRESPGAGAEKECETSSETTGRYSVAVVGDGALSSGVVFEAMNHAGWLGRNMLVILNDNKMAICPRVGGVSLYLDRMRMAPSYLGIKQFIRKTFRAIPFLERSTRLFLEHLRAALKAGLLGGMFFEELGFRYIGPIDGHNIEQLQNMFQWVRTYKEPVLLHVFTEKGRGYRPAEQDPTTYHAPSPNLKTESEPTICATIRPYSPSGGDNDGDCEPNEPNSYTYWMREALRETMRENPRICVITAAMCQGNMLEPIREEFPERFFDVGISESHAVVFAAGLAKSGMRPVVDIYSTFLQRSYDQIFQEASLQNLPIVFLLDRAGLSGPDGPTHHGVFDIAYCRPFPNLSLLSPGDPSDVEPMLRYVLRETSPSVIRYPKSTTAPIVRPSCPIERGRAETLRAGKDGVIVVYGGFLHTALRVSEFLKNDSDGNGPLDIGVVNARFAKPLDRDTILAPLRKGIPLISMEEGVLAGGFGSAILEAASEERLDTRKVHRLGIPDVYVEHGERGELLEELGLDWRGLLDQVCNHVRPRRERPGG